MTTITRAYESEHDANQAVEKLLEAGISETQISVIKPAQSSAAAADYLRAGSVLGKASAIEPLAAALENGQTLVATEAAFGSGLRISQIMDDCKPAPLDSEPADDDPYHRGTPMSFVLGMSVLSRDNPTPLSDFLGLNTKPKNNRSLTAIAGDELVDNDRPYSGLLGLPLLTNSDFSFFSRFGMAELSDKELSDTSFGMPLLSDKATPLSDAIGISPLSDSNRSTSRSFGMPKLLGENDKTPPAPQPPE